MLITYDLCEPGQRYKALIREIETFPRCCKITESCYIINTPLSTGDVLDNLSVYLDKNDRIFIAKLGKEVSSSNILTDSDSLRTSMLV